VAIFAPAASARVGPYGNRIANDVTIVDPSEASRLGSSRRPSRTPSTPTSSDTLEESALVDLPQVTSGMSWERFRAKAQAYVKEHEDHVVLQRLPPTSS
jgi:hypothetical protein